jgi:hypothetical protein
MKYFFMHLLLMGLLAVFQVFAFGCSASSLGIYGVNTLGTDVLGRNFINVVFLAPQKQLIQSHAQVGSDAFLTLNVFGGRKAWNDFSDSQPILADGKYLDDHYGGVCPTHSAWRTSRLSLLADWVREYGGEKGISGVWLDFVRYPGRWEHEHPQIPDTCYCDRCLSLFQEQAKVTIPSDLHLIIEKSAWIKENVPIEWMQWKVSQVTSFVRDARKILDNNPAGRKLKLGVFLVPWKKSDFKGSLSFNLAQHVATFAPYVDVYSPMVYHQMVGEPVDWVREITRYYKASVPGEVWPIIQAVDVSAEEFGDVVSAVSHANADGLLVYKYSSMNEEHFSALSWFTPADNLIPNPHFNLSDGIAETGAENESFQAPAHWSIGANGEIYDSQFLISPADRSDPVSIGITAGTDRQGQWSAAIPACESGATYLFTADFYRDDRSDPTAYPVVNIWGQAYRLNTHRMYGKFQPLRLTVNCPDSIEDDLNTFTFTTSSPNVAFLMRNPRLVKQEKMVGSPHQVPPAQAFFPIAAYGANSDNLAEIKAVGFNSGVGGLNENFISECLAQNIHCTLSVPRNPEKLMLLLDELKPLITKGNFIFYVNDEPGIHSFNAATAEDIQHIIKERFPAFATNMAIVRPQVIPFYEAGADYFMLDLYPIPNMPMTWLSDSMDEAAAYVGRDRLQSVIQAFGGEKYSSSGWPRLPAFEEMNCLTFLSIIHGSRGVYFFTYPEIAATALGREDIKRVVRRLNSLRSWLKVHNDEEPVKVNMVSTYRYDPAGNPAVHCTQKEQNGTRMLLCVNTIRTYVESEVLVLGGSEVVWQEYFSGDPYRVVGDSILLRFLPLEVKVLMENMH